MFNSDNDNGVALRNSIIWSSNWYAFTSPFFLEMNNGEISRTLSLSSPKLNSQPFSISDTDVITYPGILLNAILHASCIFM